MLLAWGLCYVVLETVERPANMPVRALKANLLDRPWFNRLHATCQGELE
jgi:hypothetical protein